MRRLLPLLCSSWLLVAGCLRAPVVAPPVALSQQAATSHIAVDNVDMSVFLVGDAGLSGNALLPLLAREIDARIAALGPARVAVIFLGDNEYPRGSARTTSPIVEAQVNAANRHPEMRVIFVPGNHDWAQGRSEGLTRVRNQERIVSRANVTMLPGGGCPGPVPVDLGARLRVVAVDTHWYLHEKEKPLDCHPDGSPAALTEVLNAGGARETIVVAHHPLRSGGSHGVGSGRQDQGHRANRAMRDAFLRGIAAARTPPLAWVSGHEHTLEVQEGLGARFLLVSGAGKYNDTEPVERAAEREWIFPRDTRWRPADGGFLRLDVTRDGTAARVGVYESRGGAIAEVAALLLQ
jgi:hypothetical protein